MATWEQVIPDFLLAVQAETRSSGTSEYYRKYLSQLVAWANDNCVSFDAFDRVSMRRYQVFRKTGKHARTGAQLAEATLRHDVVCARRLTRFAAEEGWLQQDPLKDYVLPKAKKPVMNCPSLEQVQQLLEAIVRRWDVRRNPKARYMAVEDRSFLRLRDYAIVITLLEAGLRIGEALTLNVDDVILEGDQARIIVRQSKTRDEREVPVTKAYCDAIAPWIEHRDSIRRRLRAAAKRAARKGVLAPANTERLFCSTVQTPIDYGTFRRSFIKYLDFAGLPRFNRHSIRHLFATLHANQNAVSAMYLLGHKRLQTTQGYVHEQRDRIRLDHAAISPIALITDTAAAPAGKRRKKQV